MANFGARQLVKCSKCGHLCYGTPALSRHNNKEHEGQAVAIDPRDKADSEK